jgi:hypothetical protein
LEEQIHARSAHDDEAQNHADVDDIFDPFLAACNSNQGKANAAFDGDEGETPWLLEDVEPLLNSHYVFVVNKANNIPVGSSCIDTLSV